MTNSTDIFSSGTNSEKEGSVQTDKQINVDAFDEALKKAKDASNRQCEYSKDQVCLWIIISILFVIISIIFCVIFYNDSRIECADSWHIIYYSVIRAGIISILFFMISFCFKMLRSYSHINQRNQFRRTLVYSIASFVEGAPELIKREDTFNKILKEFLKNDKTGFLLKEGDAPSSDIIGLLNSIKDLLSKKE